jgi:Phosphodiester glycosidase
MARLFTIFVFSLFFGSQVNSQVNWVNVDSLYQPLPASVHIYKTTDLLDGKPNIAYYVEADLKDKRLDFTADTTYQRRLTPSKFYEKNNNPLLVVNCTFFSFATNQNLNVVLSDEKILSRNIKYVNKKTGDTVTSVYVYRSAIGINKKRKADVAWIGYDSSKNYLEYAKQPKPGGVWYKTNRRTGATIRNFENPLYRWKMATAVGGGPVLLQQGEINITNNEEMMFTGKAIEDKHPRTAMGYTKNNKLIILVIEGRNPGKAEGATLTQEAQIFKDLGCWEALNLDGGGSTCMLVNGKETIKVSDATGQRPVPAVFIIRQK